ncbi:hypothetical protein [Streptomyces parvus]|uniref:hypothetical protein n=1 Tax=Streptomyces parvus TaxID=66428 RepID=UPI002100BBB3|nr:hypothetical protein [Streptomyces parvus]MCQ1576897.1 hypothetical protein [Streptomyces parvus]
MSETVERWAIPTDRWVFGLEEIPASERGEDGAVQHVAPAFGTTVISAPEGTPKALCWAAEEIVSQCGPDWAVSSTLLQWLRIEAGDELRLGVESCELERVSHDRIRLKAHYNLWDELVVPIADVRRMLIDIMDFLTGEARHPLPSWRIRRIGERSWTQKRIVE